MFGALDISTSGLVAQRTRLNVIAGNIANMHATRGPNGEPTPYQRRVALLATGNPAAGADAPGVHVAQVLKDPSPFRKVHDPGHPDAVTSGPDKGYVYYPNVDYATEMVNALAAARAYEANVTVMEITKTMASASLRLLA
jgi:flagellar basal-body rod protein FlgC